MIGVGMYFVLSTLFERQAAAMQENAANHASDHTTWFTTTVLHDYLFEIGLSTENKSVSSFKVF